MPPYMTKYVFKNNKVTTKSFSYNPKNTTFKNIQSSGMLSYISARSIRFEISYYYEVMFKQLQDNNALFDKDGMDFFDRNLPIGHLLRTRKYQVTNTHKKSGNSARTQEETYQDFIFQLSETKKILTSDKLTSIPESI